MCIATICAKTHLRTHFDPKIWHCSIPVLKLIQNVYDGIICSKTYMNKLILSTFTKNVLKIANIPDPDETPHYVVSHHGLCYFKKKKKKKLHIYMH